MYYRHTCIHVCGYGVVNKVNLGMCASQLGAPAAEQATAFHSSSLLNKRRQARRIHSKAAKGVMNEPAIAAAALLVLQ
jgi:hypothetical protein